MEQGTKFCKHCGEQIPADAVICVKCGCQVETMAQEQPSVVINNTNTNTNANTNTNMNTAGGGKAKNKWVAFCLCFFLGYLGAHKFYEGKIGVGILYLLTAGLFGIGWIIDIFVILFKPNPYYV
ncbi:MAG: TM2 domain-containing protein [Clostridium sp.]|nr:TM2 domain-containing protein [Clostridium sp.]